MMKIRNIRKYNFTLIELLVVIAIIAILASILMPALSNARVRARSTTCLNNLKTLGSIFHSYAENNRDLPPLGWTNTYGNGSSLYWPQVLMRAGYLNSRKAEHCIFSKESTSNYFLCPEDTRPVYDPSASTRMYVSYGTNQCVALGMFGVYPNDDYCKKTGANNRDGYMTFTQVVHSKKKASATPLLADCTSFANDPATTPSTKKQVCLRSGGKNASIYEDWIHTWNTPGCVSITRHGMRAGTVFCDGHVSMVNGPMYSNGKYVQWLNPHVEYDVYL